MLTVIGTIKINTKWRRDCFVNAIKSLSPVADLFSWKFNIAGQFAQYARKHIVEKFGDVEITLDDDETSTYSLQRAQMDAIQTDAAVITWQEDHWFVCPHQNLFRYLLDEFMHSNADALTVTHIITSWRRKPLLPCVQMNALYRAFYVNQKTQEELWITYPEAYVTGSPGIYKWGLANKILELQREPLSKVTHPDFELDPVWGRSFLQRHGFIDMVPNFHIFREIAQDSHVTLGARERAVQEGFTLQWMELRDETEHFGGGP